MTHSIAGETECGPRGGLGEPSERAAIWLSAPAPDVTRWDATRPLIKSPSLRRREEFKPPDRATRLMPTSQTGTRRAYFRMPNFPMISK